MTKEAVIACLKANDPAGYRLFYAAIEAGENPSIAARAQHFISK